MNNKIPKKVYIDFQDGEESAFNWLYDNYYIRICSFINRFTNSPPDSEELTQDTFVRLWQNRERVFSADALLPYLFAIARNGTIDFLRKNRVEYTPYSEEELLNYLPEEMQVDMIGEFKALELEMLLKTAINELPERQKEIFKMSRIEGMSNKEIAKKLDIPRRSVEYYIYSSLTYMKKVLL